MDGCVGTVGVEGWVLRGWKGGCQADGGWMGWCKGAMGMGRGWGVDGWVLWGWMGVGGWMGELMGES